MKFRIIEEQKNTPSDKCNDLALFDKVNDSTAFCFEIILVSSFSIFQEDNPV
jgi:hypothetical protein